MSELKERLIAVKRDFIIEVAKDLFFEKGYENTSIDEIAKSAGMSKSTLYTYIKSKEELFVHIHLQGMKSRFNILNEKMNIESTGYDNIYAIGKDYYHYFKENIGYFRLYMYEDYISFDRGKIGEKLFDEFTNLLDNLIAIWRAAFEKGIHDNSIRNDLDVGYLDKYFAYTLRTILNVAFSPEKTIQIRDTFDEERFYFQYLDLFMTAIKMN